MAPDADSMLPEALPERETANMTRHPKRHILRVILVWQPIGQATEYVTVDGETFYEWLRTAAATRSLKLAWGTQRKILKHIEYDDGVELKTISGKPLRHWLRILTNLSEVRIQFPDGHMMTRSGEGMYHWLLSVLFRLPEAKATDERARKNREFNARFLGEQSGAKAE
jgi:hypothetical protein